MATTEKANIVSKGERLTFFQLFNEKNWKIEIPIIQRDYAQGRQSSREIRDTFLNTLSDHLYVTVELCTRITVEKCTT